VGRRRLVLHMMADILFLADRPCCTYQFMCVRLMEVTRVVSAGEILAMPVQPQQLLQHSDPMRAVRGAVGPHSRQVGRLH
jgi:hypothetical protein